MAPVDKVSQKQYLQPEVLHSLSSLVLKAKYLVSGFFDGRHRNNASGSDVEFKEYRDYYFGDDMRSIDWRLYARTDQLHVKLRESETNLSSYIFMDTSRSMLYKSDKAIASKWEYSQIMAAALLMLFQKQNDARALVLLGKGLDLFIEPSVNSLDTQKMFFSLEAKKPLGQCDIVNGLKQARVLVNEKSIIFIISDFYCDTTSLEETLNYFASKGCELILLPILDPMELDFDLEGTFMLEDMESETVLSVNPIWRSSTRIWD